MKEDIAMSSKEINQVEIFERLKRREIKQGKVAKVLGLSVRQVKRKLRKHKLEGAKSLVHKSRGRVSNNKIDQETLDKAILLIKEKYWDFGPTLACEKLAENHGFKLSREKLRQEMIAVSLWKPAKRRKAHVHQLRERRSCFGELVQLDGSPHDWFEGRAPKCNLNVIIDDATSTVFAQFSQVETAQDYFCLVEKYFCIYGLPLAIYSDEHSVFSVNTPTNLDHKKPSKHNPYEGLTQFGRACRQLNIELILANTPQAKGRVERVNRTFQDRLIKEMRLQNISNIDEANEFLPLFLKKFNKKFAVKPKSSVNMHRKIPKDNDLKRILSVQEKRVLSKNLTFQYNNTIFQVKTKRSAFALRKTRVTICERPDESITVYDHRGKLLDYSTIKQLPKQRRANSKQVNQMVDAILIKQKRNPWESDPAELEQENLFYKPIGAV